MDRVKMFEMMKKLNPEFKLNEAIPTFNNSFGDSFNSNSQNPVNPSVQQINPNQSSTNQLSNYGLQTYGDLKKIINAIKSKQKGVKIGGIAIDVILNAIPYAGAAKSTFDFIKAAFGKPDTKKTNTWLDKLDVDDQASAIIDDKVENGFLAYITDYISNQPDNKQLEPNFNMNDELSKYLAKTYQDRTITGYK